jgi:hypothetical protein
MVAQVPELMSSLFPDVDGLAAGTRWQHVISSPFSENEEAAS